MKQIWAYPSTPQNAAFGFPIWIEASDKQTADAYAAVHGLTSGTRLVLKQTPEQIALLIDVRLP